MEEQWAIMSVTSRLSFIMQENSLKITSLLIIHYVTSLKSIRFLFPLPPLHLSIFSTSSSRDCWNLLLTVGAWYFLVTVLLFLMWPPLCWPMTSAWARKRFDTIWTHTQIHTVTFTASTHIYCDRSHELGYCKSLRVTWPYMHVLMRRCSSHLVLALNEQVQHILADLVVVLIEELVNLHRWVHKLLPVGDQSLPAAFMLSLV